MLDLTAFLRALPETDISVVLRHIGHTAFVITAGVGKSGHIAAKCAATFRSTGTPAAYLSLSDAGHGELGLVQGRQVVLLFSDSGRSPEIEPLLLHARRENVPVFAITSTPGAPAWNRTAGCIPYPHIPEPTPSLSCAMQMLTGDKIALAVAQHRGFCDYDGVHPAGHRECRQPL